MYATRRVGGDVNSPCLRSQLGAALGDITISISVRSFGFYSGAAPVPARGLRGGIGCNRAYAAEYGVSGSNYVIYRFIATYAHMSYIRRGYVSRIPLFVSRRISTRIRRRREHGNWKIKSRAFTTLNWSIVSPRASSRRGVGSLIKTGSPTGAWAGNKLGCQWSC